MKTKENYEQTEHKIASLWDDVKRLIALEEEILIEIKEVKASMNRLWHKAADTNQQ